MNIIFICYWHSEVSARDLTISSLIKFTFDFFNNYQAFSCIQTFTVPLIDSGYVWDVTSRLFCVMLPSCWEVCTLSGSLEWAVGGWRMAAWTTLIDTDEPIMLTEFICGEQYMSNCVTVDNRQSITWTSPEIHGDGLVNSRWVRRPSVAL